MEANDNENVFSYVMLIDKLLFKIRFFPKIGLTCMTIVVIHGYKQDVD